MLVHNRNDKIEGDAPISPARSAGKAETRNRPRNPIATVPAMSRRTRNKRIEDGS